MNGCKEDNVMKRLSIIAVTAIAALLSASCNKSIETPIVPAPHRAQSFLTLTSPGLLETPRPQRKAGPPETSSTYGSTTGTIPRRPTIRPRILSLPMTGRSGLPTNSPPAGVLRQTASLLSYMRVAITCPYAILIGIWANSSLNILICG